MSMYYGTRALTLTISLQFGADPVLFAWCALRVIEVLNTVELDCQTTPIRMGSNLWSQKISTKLGRKNKEAAYINNTDICVWHP